MLGSLARAFLPLLAATALAGEYASARLVSKAEIHGKQVEAAARMRANVPRASAASNRSGVKNITFSNPLASRTSPALSYSAR